MALCTFRVVDRRKSASHSSHAEFELMSEETDGARQGHYHGHSYLDDRSVVTSAIETPDNTCWPAQP